MVNDIVTWLAPIVSTIITAYATSLIARGEKKRDEAKAETDAKRLIEAEWREEMTEKMQLMTSSLQSTMRASLIHNAEKYFSRGSITPEEHASWCDMHDRYSAMGFNGLIDTYRAKIDQLPHVTVDALTERK